GGGGGGAGGGVGGGGGDGVLGGLRPWRADCGGGGLGGPGLAVGPPARRGGPRRVRDGRPAGDQGRVACLHTRATVRTAMPLNSAVGLPGSAAPDEGESAVVVGAGASAQRPDQVGGTGPESRGDQPGRLAERPGGAVVGGP